MADRELGRRLVHASGSIVPLAYVAEVVSWPQVQALALAATAVVGTLEAVRLSASVDWVGYRLLDRLVYRRLIRSYEEDNPGGYALFVVGGTVAAFAFPPTVAVPAFLMLTIADPVSGLLADNEYGAPKRPAVLAVTFAVGGLIAVPFVPVLPALLGALTATAADGFTPVVHGYVIDDNIGIPIGAGAAMWVGLQVPV
ncbi:MAG: dolichol kinase [Halobacteriales archaeon]